MNRKLVGHYRCTHAVSWGLYPSPDGLVQPEQ